MCHGIDVYKRQVYTVLLYTFARIYGGYKIGYFRVSEIIYSQVLALLLSLIHIWLKNKRQILFTKDSKYLQDLTGLFQSQDHRVMILWAFDLAAELVAELERKYPDERRPREALEAVSYTHLDVYKRQTPNNPDL